MNVLFVSDMMENFSAGGFEPLGLMHLSSSLKKAGHKTDLVEADLSKIEKKIDEFQPSMLAYSTTTGLHKLYLALNKEIRKKYDIFSIFGGPHPTFVTDFINEDFVDAICIGEGEDAIIEVADRLQRKEGMQGVKSIYYKYKAKVYKNEIRPLRIDLDDMPHADREIYYQFKQCRETKMKSFILNRGCAFRCTYCFHQQFLRMYGKQGMGGVRHRSVDNIIGEISYVKNNYPLELVRINDPSIAFNTKWLKEFCEKYKEKIGLPFTCNIYPGQTNEVWIRLLKESGCKAMFWAVESGNDYLRMKVLNRKVPKEKIYKTSELIKKYNMNSTVQNMVGLPKGSLDADLETLDVNIKLKPSYSWVSIYQPYPGTSLYDEAIKEGLFDGNIDSIQDTYHIDSVMTIKDKRKVENLQKIFAIVVEFSFLRPLVPFLIGLPLGRFYDFFRKILKGYCFLFRSMPYKLSPPEFVATGFRAMFGKGG